MKKVFFLAVFATISISISAQSVSYSVECIKPDSCFLKEVSAVRANESEPRAQIVTTYKLFRSLSEFDAIVSAVQKQAADELSKGMEMVKRANEMNAIADKLRAVRPKQ